ncbi:hypothetical protein F5B18DRAFT_610092 [Nemania serpens]|nr:hypothetical protein F5B18DRAFT_610092 [Nemania serpens]
MHLPFSAKVFNCTLKPPYYGDYNQVLPRFVEDGSPDPVSCAIRRLTRHCKEIVLYGTFGLSLFDPPTSGPAAEEQPCWQSTTTLRVRMLPCTPDGSWLLRPKASSTTPIPPINLPGGLIDCTQLPPGYRNTTEEYIEDEEYDSIHGSVIDLNEECGSVHSSVTDLLTTGGQPVPEWDPDNENLSAMITAFARCCNRMPALKVADVRFDPLGSDLPIQLLFVAALHRMDDWDEDDMANNANACRVYLHIGNS